MEGTIIPNISTFFSSIVNTESKLIKIILIIFVFILLFILIALSFFKDILENDKLIIFWQILKKQNCSNNE